MIKAVFSSTIYQEAYTKKNSVLQNECWTFACGNNIQTMTDHIDGFHQVKCLMLVLLHERPLYFFVS